MKASQFRTRIRRLFLKQGAEGVPVADIVSRATYTNWQKKHDGLLPNGDEANSAAQGRKRASEKHVADRSLDEEMPQDVIRRKL